MFSCPPYSKCIKELSNFHLHQENIFWIFNFSFWFQFIQRIEHKIGFFSRALSNNKKKTKNMASLLLRLILVRRIRMPQLKSQQTPLKTLKVLLVIKVGLFYEFDRLSRLRLRKKNPCNMTLIQFFITDPLQTGLQCTEVRDHSSITSSCF